MKRYKPLTESKTVGYITFKELQDAYPKLAQAYQQIFNGKKPKIRLSADAKFTFSGSYGDGYKNIVAVQRNNQVETIEGSWGGSNMFVKTPVDDYNKPINLIPGDAILDCQIGGGGNGSCSMVIHPDGLTPMLPSNRDELSLIERGTLRIIKGIKSAYRQKNFLDLTRGNDYTVHQFVAPDADPKAIVAERKAKYPDVKSSAILWDLICKELALKELVKIASNGSVTITLKGANLAVQWDQW